MTADESPWQTTGETELRTVTVGGRTLRVSVRRDIHTPSGTETTAARRIALVASVSV